MMSGYLCSNSWSRQPASFEAWFKHAAVLEAVWRRDGHIDDKRIKNHRTGWCGAAWRSGRGPRRARRCSLHLIETAKINGLDPEAYLARAARPHRRSSDQPHCRSVALEHRPRIAASRRSLILAQVKSLGSVAVTRRLQNSGHYPFLRLMVVLS
jgi:hypothetical protein